MISRILLFFFCGLLLSCNHGKKNGELEDSNYLTIPDSELDKINMCTEMSIDPDSIKMGISQASGKQWLFWSSSKKILYVSFVDGDPVVQKKVELVAKEWENYCGKVFQFITPGKDSIKPDITVSFKESGSWSLIGIKSITNVPSMNLGWLTPNTDDAEYHRVVLHEFGHALGLVHEHQNPENNPIKWNKEYVYAFYKKKLGWPKSVTYANFFEKYDADEMNSTDFDSKSIMLYGIPVEFTTNGFHTMANTQLSETDKYFIGMIYPKNN